MKKKMNDEPGEIIQREKSSVEKEGVCAELQRD
jgi:hypothetical protein